MHQYSDAADAIHERMMQLDYERGTLTINSLDNYCPPGRKLCVEAGGGHHLG